MPRWTDREEEYLAKHAADGADSIAEALGRSATSVQSHASRMGVSLCRRYHCPKCGRWSYRPLTKWSGWCRKCSIEHSADTAALKNRQIRKEIAEEKAAIRKEEQRRQMIYSDTDRRKRELKKLRRNREGCKRNAKSKGSADEN